jgi:hypothetical protein
MVGISLKWFHHVHRALFIAKTLADPTLDQGDDGAVLLSALAVFQRPTTVAKAVTHLGRKAGLDAGAAREVIQHLVDGRFLQPGDRGTSSPNADQIEPRGRNH